MWKQFGQWEKLPEVQSDKASYFQLELNEVFMFEVVVEGVFMVGELRNKGQLSMGE